MKNANANPIGCVCVAWSGTRDDELPESAKPRARQNWEVCGVCRVCVKCEVSQRSKYFLKRAVLHAPKYARAECSIA